MNRTATFNQLFATLSPHISSLFPSTRMASRVPFGTQLSLDAEDEAVWNFLAALAVSADSQQQHTLVSEAREKVLENVASSTQKNVPAETKELKLVSSIIIGATVAFLTFLMQRNTNLLLHALGLDTALLMEGA